MSHESETVVHSNNAIHETVECQGNGQDRHNYTLIMKDADANADDYHDAEKDAEESVEEDDVIRDMKPRRRLILDDDDDDDDAFNGGDPDVIVEDNGTVLTCFSTPTDPATLLSVSELKNDLDELSSVMQALALTEKKKEEAEKDNEDEIDEDQHEIDEDQHEIHEDQLESNKRDDEAHDCYDDNNNGSASSNVSLVASASLEDTSSFSSHHVINNESTTDASLKSFSDTLPEPSVDSSIGSSVRLSVDSSIDVSMEAGSVECEEKSKPGNHETNAANDVSADVADVRDDVVSNKASHFTSTSPIDTIIKQVLGEIPRVKAILNDHNNSIKPDEYNNDSIDSSNYHILHSSSSICSRKVIADSIAMLKTQIDILISHPEWEVVMNSFITAKSTSNMSAICKNSSSSSSSSSRSSSSSSSSSSDEPLSKAEDTHTWDSTSRMDVEAVMLLMKLVEAMQSAIY